MLYRSVKTHWYKYIVAGHWLIVIYLRTLSGSDKADDISSWALHKGYYTHVVPCYIYASLSLKKRPVGYMYLNNVNAMTSLKWTPISSALSWSDKVVDASCRWLPLALRTAADTVLPGEEWDKSCIQQGDRRPVSRSVLKTHTHTHSPVCVPVITQLSGPISSFPASPSRVGSGTAASAQRSSQRHQSRTASAVRGVAVSSRLRSHNPECPAAPSPTARR